ncbi:MAG: transporter [Chloroflexi bacterium]|jgi:ZIP family zinc transporter|nr:transporter [Chloroflexota bacterium]MDB5076879.1 transporter [Chloroflexota bacterium]
MSELTTALLYTLVPVATAAVAGTIAAFRPPHARVTSAVQHFAAGVVFAAAAIELLPELLKNSPISSLLGFALGIVVMFSLRWAGERAERRGAGSAGLLLATGADFLVDGVVLGAGFVAGGQTGALLTVAISVEYLFVGVAVAAALGAVSHARKIGIPTGLALLTTLGAGIGVVTLAGAPGPVLATVLAFGAVAFMYLVTEELLVRAHEQGETAFGSVLFFVGFLLYLVIEELAGTVPG